jgi:hypothetical protein
LLPPTNDKEWTLAVGCSEFLFGTGELVNCIKILQILKSNFQLSTNNPIKYHYNLLSRISDEDKGDDSDYSFDDKCFINQI